MGKWIKACWILSKCVISLRTNHHSHCHAKNIKDCEPDMRFCVESKSRKTNNRQGGTAKEKNKAAWATRHIYRFQSQLPACLQRRKSELCQVLLTLMEFWQEKQLHCSEIKGEHTLLPPPPLHHLPGSLSRHLIQPSNTFFNHFQCSQQRSVPWQHSNHVFPLPKPNQQGSESVPDRKLGQKPNVFPA